MVRQSSISLAWLCNFLSVKAIRRLHRDAEIDFTGHPFFVTLGQQGRDETHQEAAFGKIEATRD
jgi:hypothetical protein